MAPFDAPTPKQSPEGDAPPTGRKFACSACGAKLDFDPASQALKCPYCGHVEKIQATNGDVEEHDYEAYLKHRAGVDITAIPGRSEQVRCTGCGAVVLLEDKLVTDRCPYCSTHLENKPEAAEAMIAPESLLPFAVDQRAARGEFNRWIAGLWFAPSQLKRLADLGQISGIYVPFWTYDSMTFTHYTGQRGDDYQDSESYTEQDADGNTVTRTRSVTRTRWYPVAGDVQHFFDDVLVCASKSLPDDMVATLEPWDLKALEGFRPEFLSGFKTERYAIGLEDGFGRARQIMDGHIRRLCCQDIGGDHQTLDQVQTKHQGVSFKHLLLPVWVASYRYQNELFQILINARTGEVVGRRPYSMAKIVSLVLILAVLALLAWFLFAKANGAPVQRPTIKPQVAQPGRAYAAIKAFADLSPSTAALTMPPAYPAPSPTGYNPSMPGDMRVSGSRTIRTGELPRASGPARTASGKNFPCQRRSMRGNPSATAAATAGGNTSRMSADTTPRG
jgi:DNA-directed RNA polymerase subunit RPC12/RpoP